MRSPCLNAVTACPVPAQPGTGYLAETPDALDWLGVGYGPAQPPPLDYSFINPRCLVIVNSTVSQAAASATASQQSIQCVQSQTFTPQGAEDALPIPTNPPEFIDVTFDSVPPILD
jgi:hypothetical protein